MTSPPTDISSNLEPIGSLSAGDSPPPQPSSLTLPTPPSETEAKLYYYGLPSRPVLVARSGNTPWKVSSGPFKYPPTKELRPLGNHAPRLRDVWADKLGPRFYKLLDSMKVKWTSFDLLRIGNEGESFAPVVIWIGVMPQTLSSEDGVAAVSRCHELLDEYDITDVEVEIRESTVWRGPG